MVNTYFWIGSVWKLQFSFQLLFPTILHLFWRLRFPEIILSNSGVPKLIFSKCLQQHFHRLGCHPLLMAISKIKLIPLSNTNLLLKWSIFCSFDVRGRQFQQAKLWSSKEVFDRRAHFRFVASPALVIDRIELEDEGIYRCRVDFKNSPTRNSKVNFTVIGEYF